MRDGLRQIHPQGETGFSISRDFPDRTQEYFISLPEEQLRRFRVISGHVHFGFHHHLPQPCRYITIFREPVDRILSHYYYNIHQKPKDFKGDPERLEQYRQMPIDEFILHRVNHNFDNMMVRYISGIEAEVGACTDAMLETAIQNLEEHFDAIGLQDRFNESVAYFCCKFGWSIPSYRQNNVGTKRPLVTPLTPAQRSRIRESQHLDAQLYDYAVKRFERQMADLPPGFNAALKAYLGQRQSFHGLRTLWRHHLRPMLVRRNQ